MLNAAFDLRELLEAANHRQGRERLAKLREADCLLHAREDAGDEHGKQRRLKRRNAINDLRRWRALTLRYAEGQITFEQLTAAAQGWANHARYGNTVGLRKAVLGGVIP